MNHPEPDRSTPWERINQRPHVVILSDDPDLRDFLGEGLLLAGFWTSAIASGIQAIEVFRMRRFDLIMIDGRIQGLSAFEIVRRLRGTTSRSGPPLTEAPIAMVDAAQGEAERRLFMAAGEVEFFDSPIEIEDIAARLMTMMATWRESHPDEPWADASVPQARGPRGDDVP